MMLSATKSAQSERLFQSPSTVTKNNPCSSPTYAETLLLHKGFHFRQRRDTLDLRGLSKVDTAAIEREVDVDALQSFVENITFANVTEEDISLYSDDTFVTLFRLSQLCTEHLMHTQDVLAANLNALAKKYSAKKREMASMQSDIREKDAEISRLREEILTSKRAVAAYESTLRFPPASPHLFVQPPDPSPAKLPMATNAPASAELAAGKDPISEMRDDFNSKLKSLEAMIRREVRQEVSLLANDTEQTAELQVVKEEPSVGQQPEEANGMTEALASKSLNQARAASSSPRDDVVDPSSVSISPRDDEVFGPSSATSSSRDDEVVESSSNSGLDVDDELQSEKELSNSSAAIPIPAEEEIVNPAEEVEHTKFAPTRTMNTTGDQISTLTPDKFDGDSLASPGHRNDKKDDCDPLNAKVKSMQVERRFDFDCIISNSTCSDGEADQKQDGFGVGKPYVDDESDMETVEDESPGIELSSYDSIEDAHYRKARKKRSRSFSRRRFGRKSSGGKGLVKMLSKKFRRRSTA